jgi:hypothetical protein
MILGSGIRDPGSGKNPFRIPDPGVKKATDPESRIRIRNTDFTSTGTFLDQCCGSGLRSSIRIQSKNKNFSCFVAKYGRNGSGYR